MAAAVGHIINKYQGVAPQPVIQAVRVAASRTGADFAFLMEKASAESSFNPRAAARTSSAKGLFQFIESTWLGMVRQHGHKYGLGKYADQIRTRGGRPCVDDGATRREILALRDDPRISALMAGEFTAQNKAHLEKNTCGPVGPTELYLAHFMGAGGAAKFLNSRAVNGGVPAAELFPRAAAANRNVFYERATDRARTLDEIYGHFAKKFDKVNGGGSSSSTAATKPRHSTPLAAASSPARAPAPHHAPLQDSAGQALPIFDDADESDDIIWNDDPRFYAVKALSAPRLPAAAVIAIAEMAEPPHADSAGRRRDRFGYNS